MMKIKIKTISFACLLISSGVFASAATPATPPNKIWIYEIGITNGKTDVRNLDLNSALVAAVLVANKMDPNCVDLQLTDWAERDDLLEHGTITFVMTKELSADVMKQIAATGCKDAGADCKTSVTGQEYSFNDIELRAYPDAGPYLGTPTIHRLKDVEQFPQFSPACTTGKYADSWKGYSADANPHNVPLAEAWLRKLGVDTDEVVELTLFTSAGNDGLLFAFGFPKIEK